MNKTISTPRLIFKLLKLVKPLLWVIIIASINGIIGYLLAINITVFASLAIMKILGIDIVLSYFQIGLIIILSGFLRGIVRYFEQYFNHFMAFKLLALIRMKLFSKLRKESISKFDEQDDGELVSTLQGDIETLEVFYAHTITPFLIAMGILIIIVTFLSIFVSVYVGLISLVSFILIGFIIPLIFYKANSKDGRMYRESLGKFNSFYLESIFGGFEIISSRKQKEYQDLLEDKDQKLGNLYTKLETKNNLFSSFSGLIIMILYLVMIGIGALLIYLNIIDSPYIIISYVTLASSFGPFLALNNLPNNLSQTFASGNRIVSILEEEEEKDLGSINLDYENDEFQSLTFNDVSFAYPNEDKLILNSLNLDVQKGKIIGIKAPSGSGKSTILKLIMRFYSVSKGSILLNGRNIEEYSLESLYKNINLFSQSTYLFSDTILNNLKISKEDATSEEIKVACKNAGILDYILSQKDGFNTRISDLKNNISEGEKQRIGLARVFLRKPKLLLLDEATANIDSLNEGLILKSLKKYSKDMTIIIVSHLDSTLKISDEIYTLKEGKLCLVS